MHPTYGDSPPGKPLAGKEECARPPGNPPGVHAPGQPPPGKPFASKERMSQPGAFLELPWRGQTDLHQKSTLRHYVGTNL